MKQHYLVTGGFGFIGSHTVTELLRYGKDVTVLERDANSLYRSCTSSFRHNIPYALNFGDLKCQDFDGIFHFGASSSTLTDVQTASNDFDLGCDLVDYASGRCIPIIYASSAAVYKNCEITSMSEDADLGNLDSFPYAYYKRKLELYAVSRPLAIGFRLFNVWSHVGEEHKSQPSGPFGLLKSLRTFGKLSVDPKPAHRDWVHVSDVVRIALQLLHRRGIGVLNIGSGFSQSFHNIAKQLCREHSLSLDSIKYDPILKSPNYQSYTQADTTKLKSLTTLPTPIQDMGINCGNYQLQPQKLTEGIFPVDEEIF